MSSLFIIGNTKRYTFANAIAAAQLQSSRHSGTGLQNIFVLHSPESQSVLCNNSDWIDYLLKQGIRQSVFVQFCVDLKNDKQDGITSVARHMENCVRSIDRRDEIYVDLTNGTSLYKGIFSNLAYILGASKTFYLDSGPTDNFMSTDALERAYFQLPDSSCLDSIAPSWLTEVRRFGVFAHEAATTLSLLNNNSVDSVESFERDVHNAIDDWFIGQKRKDGSRLGGSVRHIGRAFEDLVRSAHTRLAKPAKGEDMSLAAALDVIRSRLNDVAPGHEPDLLGDISQLLRTLRNDSTHETTSKDFGRIRARLSTELLLASAEYFKILHHSGVLSPKQTPQDGSHVSKVNEIVGLSGERYFFGLDGDDTGRGLEQLFQSNAAPQAFSKFSASIDTAIKRVKAMVTKVPIAGEVLFASGDDILFHGSFDKEALEQLRELYRKESGGKSCSIGFGESPRAAYIALKTAKASPGKNTIKGIVFV